jgi:hypothetical protein
VLSALQILLGSPRTLMPRPLKLTVLPSSNTDVSACLL